MPLADLASPHHVAALRAFIAYQQPYQASYHLLSTPVTVGGRVGNVLHPHSVTNGVQCTAKRQVDWTLKTSMTTAPNGPQIDCSGIVNVINKSRYSNSLHIGWPKKWTFGVQYTRALTARCLDFCIMLLKTFTDRSLFCPRP